MTAGDLPGISTDPVYRLSPVEIAAGAAFGVHPGIRPLPLPSPGDTPLLALERAILPALQRTPSLITFSGGRDSSTVLAAAVRLARREGLPLPVAVSNIFPRALLSDESDWQQRVLRHLKLTDWLRLEFDDELDLIGPVARGVLTHHGLAWPFNTHFLLPMIEAAAGGALLTGVFGDQVFTPSRYARAWSVLHGKTERRRGDRGRVMAALSPQWVRRRIIHRRHPLNVPWIQPSALTDLERAYASEEAHHSYRWDRDLEWWWQRRHLHVPAWWLGQIASASETIVIHPLTDAAFLAAVGRFGGSEGFADRTAALQACFGSLLPAEFLARSTKATFDDVFWNRHTRAFLAGWTGEGVDRRVVDVDALRATWFSDQPDPRSWLLLQAVWLAVGV